MTADVIRHPSSSQGSVSKFRRLFEESLAIQQHDAWKTGDVGFINRVMVQATLPYREPKGDPPAWGRKAGNVSLVIQPGMYLVQTPGGTSEKLVPRSLGYPFGAKPRLILAWLGREVKRQDSREIKLGKSLRQFLEEIGIDNASGGQRGTITQTREQMRRLFSARIALIDDVHPAQVNWSMDGMQIADRQQLWWDPSRPDQSGLFESTVFLSERFFNEMKNHSVPVDMRALRVLRSSPFELDLYCWLTYRFYSLSKRTVVPWEALQAQFGSEDKNERKFRWQLRKSLRAVLLVYPGAKVEDSPSGLVLTPSLTSVRMLPRLAGSASA
jgi:hypothetical protein